MDIKTLIDKITNPLLYYVDKSGKSIFRNYCIYKNDGCLYEQTFSIQKAGKVLEYRMELDKKLNFATVIITFLTYLVLIRGSFSILNILFCELIWLFMYFGCRYICAYLYKNKLLSVFGKYTIVEFKPNISAKKRSSFKQRFLARFSFIILILFIFFAPAFLLLNLIKFDLNSKKPSFKAAIFMSNIYNFIYPKTFKILDMSAYAKYMTEDYEGALKDYKNVLKMSGRKLTKTDFIRFANLLYLEKKLYGSQNAIDLFNEYATKKNMSVLEQTQMLWIKSIFSINNQAYEAVIADYDDLLASLNKNDKKNEFYILSDKAYMLYLMGEYSQAITIYDSLIKYAQANEKNYKKEITSLYAERGFAKRHSGDYIGADTDFNLSKIDIYELNNYEPIVSDQGFLVEKF